MTTGRLGRQRRAGTCWVRGLRVLGLWGCGICLAVTGTAQAGSPAGTTELLLKAKPAVVIIVTEVSSTVRLTCPNGSPQRVALDPSQAHGTGFLITPDGYIVTNGHVVQAYHDANDQEIEETSLRQAVEQVCVNAGLSKDRRRQMVDSLLPRISPAAGVEIKKTLTVVLSNREAFVAEVKAYSPPLAESPGKRVSGKGGSPRESGKDVAIVKIDAKNLPTIALGNSDRAELGQAIHILGFPGVVMYHDLLDKRSAVEASVTSGRISSLKRDARGAPVIQTDAAASWGNSGGPAINEQGEVVGILTFISLTADETQAIQGFNFLVPANIVREFARAAGVTADTPSPFNAVWHEAVARYTRGDFAGAQSRLDAADRLVPNLPDVQRLQTEVQLRLLQSPRGFSPWLIGGIAAFILAVGGVAWWGWRRRSRRQAATTGMAGSEPSGVAVPAPALPVPVRVSAEELARAIGQRPDLVLVDVREPASYAASQFMAKGALRATAEDVLQACSALSRDQGIVLYCDSPDETASAHIAQRLMAAGYARVAVLAGGFSAWRGASLPLERTPHGREAGAASKVAILPPESARSSMTQEAVGVDLPVGVKGSGPYFNARATRLGLKGLSLKAPQPLAVGQALRLTIFLRGEPLELAGHVVSGDPEPSGGQTRAVEVAFDALSEEQSVVLEGFILAHRTDPRP
jgi:serine protease Do